MNTNCYFNNVPPTVRIPSAAISPILSLSRTNSSSSGVAASPSASRQRWSIRRARPASVSFSDSMADVCSGARPSLGIWAKKESYLGNASVSFSNPHQLLPPRPQPLRQFRQRLLRALGGGADGGGRRAWEEKPSQYILDSQ